MTSQDLGNDSKSPSREAGKETGYEHEFFTPPPKQIQSGLHCKVKVPCDEDDTSPRKEENTGYECAFVEPPPESLRHECPICLQILREPRLIDCCGHNFCAACIGRVEDDGRPCPLCNEPLFTTMANKGLKRDLNEFRVHCPHHLFGCEWVGELGKVDEHLNSDSQPQRQLEGCPFAVIECLHCKEGIRRDKVAGHQLERCPQRPYSCEYCTEYKSTFKDVIHCHWVECKCFLLPCPNNCTPSGSGIQRQYLDQHVEEECPLTVVQCELHHAGCEVTLPRKDMADHMKEATIAHISLLAAENHRQCKRLLEREEQMILLTQRNIDLEERTTKQSQDLKEAQRQAIDQLQTQQELAQKITSQSQELTQTKQSLTQTKQELRQEVTIQSQEFTRVKQELIQTEQELRQQVIYQSQELTRVKHELMQIKQELTQKATFQDHKLEDEQEAQRHVIERLQIQQQRALQELTRIKQDLTQKVTSQTQLLRSEQELMHRVTSQSQEFYMVKAELKESQRQAIDRLQTQQQSDLRELARDVEMQHVVPLTIKIAEFDEAIERLQTQQQHDLQELRTQVEMQHIVPVTIKIAGFDEVKRMGTRWHSRPFYTGMGGYKMCLDVDTNGCGAGRGTHVSVFTYLMRGEFDSRLKWPFRGTITIQLVNQLEDKEHRTDTISYTDTTPIMSTARVTDGERSGGWGKPEYILRSDLGLNVPKNHHYLKDDCLVFRIVSVKLK